MIKNICAGFGVGFVSLIFPQTLDPIPFDWSGQNGMSTNQGILIWNRDWYSGKLFFDGTFHSFPLQFGDRIFAFSDLKEYKNETYDLFPDSNEVITSFDYRQGDYFFDQFNLNGQFKKPSQIIEWNGFKRSYGGPYSQFVQLENRNSGVLDPNQQSYCFHFSGMIDSVLSTLSVGRFITDSGLYNNSETNGVHRDEITTASASSQFQWQQKNIQFSLNQFMEKRRWVSEFSKSQLHYLNRGRFSASITPENEKDNGGIYGISGNTQSLTFPDTTIAKNRSWISGWGMLKREKFELSGGFDTGENTVLPRFEILMNKSWNSYHWKQTIALKNYPQHLVIWNDSRPFFETWLVMNTQLNWKNDPLEVFGGVNYWRSNNLVMVQGDSTLTPIELMTINWGFNWMIRQGIRWSGNWIHSTNKSTISDGIGDRIKTEIEITKRLFSDNMELTSSLVIEGILNRDSSFGFDPGLGRPFENEWQPYALPDYLTAHWNISAKVSSVIITYRIRNLFHAQENTIKQMYPDVPKEWIWPRNNAYFLPMGQLVSFGVEWEFEN